MMPKNEVSTRRSTVLTLRKRLPTVNLFHLKIDLTLMKNMLKKKCWRVPSSNKRDRRTLSALAGDQGSSITTVASLPMPVNSELK